MKKFSKIVGRVHLNRKGQIIALDFMLSALIVFAAIGFLMQGHELSALDAKELSTENLFSSMTETISEKLLLSDLAICDVEDTSGNIIPNYKLIHCINSNTFKNLTKNVLGIPGNINCNIALGHFNGTTFITSTTMTECNNTIPNNSQTKYSIIRKTLVSSTNVSKKDLENCIKGNNCLLQTNYLRVVLWSQ